MAKEKYEFYTPSKGVSFLEGMMSGLQEHLKTKKEQEMKAQQGEMAMLKALLPGILRMKQAYDISAAEMAGRTVEGEKERGLKWDIFIKGLEAEAKSEREGREFDWNKFMKEFGLKASAEKREEKKFQYEYEGIPGTGIPGLKFMEMQSNAQTVLNDAKDIIARISMNTQDNATLVELQRLRNQVDKMQMDVGMWTTRTTEAGLERRETSRIKSQEVENLDAAFHKALADFNRWSSMMAENPRDNTIGTSAANAAEIALEALRTANKKRIEEGLPILMPETSIPKITKKERAWRADYYMPVQREEIPAPAPAPAKTTTGVDTAKVTRYLQSNEVKGKTWEELDDNAKRFVEERLTEEELKEFKRRMPKKKQEDTQPTSKKEETPKKKETVPIWGRLPIKVPQ